jgi:hypothetical protein
MKFKIAQRRIARALVTVLAFGFIQTGLSATPAVAAPPIEPTISSLTSRPTSLIVNMVNTGIDATSWRWSITRKSGVSCANPLGDGVVQSTSSLVSSFSISSLTAGCIYSVKVAGYNGVIGEYTDSEELVGAFTNGLTVYYANDPESGTAMIRRPISASTTGYCGWETVTQISQNWSTGAPAPTNPSGTCNADNFTAYYIGYIKAPTTGNVTFKSRSDDNFYLNIQGANLIADNTAHGPAGPGLFDAQATIAMTAGEIYRIEAWMHEIGTGAAAYLDWQYGAVGQQIIPSEWLATDPSVFYGGCPIGLAERCAAGSAQEIKQSTGMNMNGQYWIMVNGVPTLTYCIMDSAMSGGGWMMAMKGRKTSSGFGYSSAYWTNTATTGEAYPERWQANNSNRDIDAKYGVFAYNKGNQIMALFPEQTTYAGGATNALNATYGFSWIETTTAGRTWTSSDGDSYATDLRTWGGPNGSSCVSGATTLTNLFTNSNRCVFRKVSATYSASESPYSAIGDGLFYSQTQIRFFGINYGSNTSGNMALARWGFGWNENSSTFEGSNDGSSGIGLAYQSYSIQTGSINGCCATQIGISGGSLAGPSGTGRNIPFEMYIRNTVTASVTAVNMRVSSKRTSSQTSGSNVSVSGTNGSNTFRLSPVIDGLTIDSSTGVISVSDGVPVGTYTQSVSVIDTNGVSGSRSITIQVVADSYETDTALFFDGTRSIATAGTFPAISGDQTIEAWVKPWGICGVSSEQFIFGSDNLALRCKNYRWYLSVKLTTTYWSTYASAQNVNPNTWVHLAAVRSGNLFSLFINQARSRLLDSVWGDTVTVANASFLTSAYAVGGNSGSANFQGQVDEFKVWSEARTATQITEGMYAAPSLNNSKLDAYWDFNEGSGTSASSRALRSNSNHTFTPADTQWRTVAETTTSGPYTVVSIPRSLISVTPGWRVPDSITAATVLLAGGGGGGAGTFIDRPGDPGGAGGAGGVYYAQSVPLEPKSVISLKVGAGGTAGVPSNVRAETRGISGATTTFDALSAGGGGAGGYVDSTNQDGLPGTAGGAGGGASNFWEAYKAGDPGVSTSATVNGKVYSARTTAGAGTVFSGTYGYTGGGAAGPGSATSKGPGYLYDISGETVTYGVGGGSHGVTGWSFDWRTSSGNGGDASYNVTGGDGGAGGGNGIIVIRYITKLKPTFTAPTNTTINLGMTESFTTNVAQDSFTVGLTRTFRWESTTGGLAGTFSLIKSETGTSGATFSWVPPDTSTSGSNYRYRVIVTDSDADGLFIVETSTSVFAVINGTLRLVGKNSLSKTVNINKSETFTVSGGTSTFRYSLTPDGPNFVLDTSTVASPVIRFTDTATVGTYYETLTVTDSISVSVSIPLTITINPPPSFSANTALVDSGTVLYLDAGNSSSYARTGTTWRDMSGRANHTSLVQNMGSTAYYLDGSSRSSAKVSNNYTCVAPVFDPSNLGSFEFTDQTQCIYVPTVLPATTVAAPVYTFETWVKRNGDQAAWEAIACTPYRNDSDQIPICLMWYGTNTLIAGIFNGSAWQLTTTYTVPDQTWVHAAVTYNGSNTLSMYINDTVTPYQKTDVSVTWNRAKMNAGLLIGRKWDDTWTYSGNIAMARIYNRILTQAEIAQNFNATKGRFLGTQNKMSLKGKYGTTVTDTYTVTAGSETVTATFTSNAISGLIWDTSTARSVRLQLQESLTADTYNDTITVTDIYGASTNIPIRIVVDKADTLTVYIDTPTALNFTGSTSVFDTNVRVVGLVSGDTGTAVSRITYKPGATSCALGGVCAVGDIGPGGGIVFITPSTSGNTTGKYFEAAPFNWAGMDDLSTTTTYCSNSTLDLVGTSALIGWGETNTRLAINQCLGGAVALVNNFNSLNNTGYSNWFIPSTNEITELAKVRNDTGLIKLGAQWNIGRYGYWSSTQSTSTVMQSMVSSTWTMGGTNKNDSVNNMIRPVRMFTPCNSVDSCTSLSSTSKPTYAGQYFITPETLTVTVGNLSNYVAIRYQPTMLTINRVAQAAQVIPTYNPRFPETFTIYVGGGSSTGVLTYSVISGGNASGCAFDYKKLTSSTEGTCNIQVVRAGDRNYLPDTATSLVHYYAFVINQPAPAVGSGPNIALTGETAIYRNTNAVPTISAVTTSGNLVTINGTGFGSTYNTSTIVRFWFGVEAEIRGDNSGNYVANDTTIYIYSVPVGATTGRITVQTANGTARSSTNWVAP